MTRNEEFDNLTTTNTALTITAGNGLASGGGVALGSSVTLDIASGGVQTDELDLSIAPTWTSQHTFSSGIDMGSTRIQNLAAPSADTDAARKQYVDALEQGLDIKDSVRAAADSNIDLTSSTDPNSIDGVTLNDGDRVLLFGQTDASENGIYVAQTATDPTTWVRAADADEDSEVTSGMFTFIEEGNTYNNRGYVLNTSGSITLGTTSLDFTQFSGAGQITAGDGIKKSGDTLNIEPADFAGNGTKDDGSDNIAVEPVDFAGNALTDDGADNLAVASGAIQTDELDLSIAPTWTSQHQFSAGIDSRGDIVDDTQTVWDTSAQEIPDSAMGSIDNSTLTNSSLTITGGDGLKNGGSVALGGSVTIDVEPADFAGNALVDDGSDNLAVASNGITTAEIDEAIDPVWTTEHTFNAGLKLSTGQSVRVPDDGANETAVDLSVTSSPTTGTEVSYGLGIDGSNLLEVYAEADGAGATQNTSLRSQVEHQLASDLVTTGGTAIWNSTGGYLEQTALENDSLTVTAGDGLKNGGSVALGGSLTIDVEPADFAGSFLSDDGSDNLQVNVGNGIEGDGSGNIRVNPAAIAGNALTEDTTTTLGVASSSIQTTELDLSIAPTWTSKHQFDAGISVNTEVTSTGTNGALEIDEEASVSDTSKVQLSTDAEPLGYAMVQDVTNGETALVRVDGASGNATIVDQAGSHFTTTEGNTGTVNIYYDSTNARYELENQTGASATFSLELMKA